RETSCGPPRFSRLTSTQAEHSRGLQSLTTNSSQHHPEGVDAHTAHFFHRDARTRGRRVRRFEVALRAEAAAAYHYPRTEPRLLGHDHLRDSQRTARSSRPGNGEFDVDVHHSRKPHIRRNATSLPRRSNRRKSLTSQRRDHGATW